MPSHRARPPINRNTFQRDVYLLVSMLLSIDEIERIEGISEAARFHARGEINRLLILLATSARQMMDMLEKGIGDRNCGTRQMIEMDGVNEAADGDAILTFYAACNSIIHATEIKPHVQMNEGEPKRMIEISGTVSLKGGTERMNTSAELDSIEFAKCCTMLIKEFAQ